MLSHVSAKRVGGRVLIDGICLCMCMQNKHKIKALLFSIDMCHGTREQTLNPLILFTGYE